MRNVKLTVVAFVFLFACAVCVGVRRGAAANSSAAEKPDAKQLYARNCARCHGADGRGETELGKAYGSPDLTDADWQRKVGDKRLTASITNGRENMPAFGKRLSHEEIVALVAYVRTFKNK